MTLITFGSTPGQTTPVSSEVDPDEMIDDRSLSQQFTDGFGDARRAAEEAIAEISGNAGKQIGGFIDSATARLANAGLNFGGANASSPSSSGQARFAGGEDARAKLSLSPKSGPILYRDPANKLLRPLVETNGIVWPYTPTINSAYTASYGTMNPTHSNYAQLSYNFSSVDAITCVGAFTANTPSEAAYLLAVINFMRSAVKMFFGNDQLRGTPPPVLRFSAYGTYIFNSVPVVITNFSQDFEPGVDYIDAYANGAVSKVPTSMTINCTMQPVVSRSQQRDWSLEKYARGQLTGSSNGTGGTL